MDGDSVCGAQDRAELRIGQGDLLAAAAVDEADAVSATAGAPLDNNIAERALKKAILHRKNALFCKTTNGARVGDLFMSLIHTCELNKANPFDYLTELLRHPLEMKASPAEWMPWNYRETPARSTRPVAA
jgi:hypothetical protein